MSHHIAFFFAIIVLASACQTIKNIPKGSHLYEGGEIKIDGKLSTAEKRELSNALEEVNRPEPNKKILGLRLGLWARQKVEREKAGFYAKWINKKIGESAVLLDDVNPKAVQKLMLNRMENLGYFEGSSAYERVTSKKTGLIKYEVEPKKRLKITTIDYQQNGDGEIDSLIIKYLEREKPIKPGDGFSLDKLQQTRQEIADDIKKNGYYYFSGKFLEFEADTLSPENNHETYLKLSLKESISSDALVPYEVREITVFPQYRLQNENNGVTADTVEFEGISFVQKNVFFRPDRLYPYIFIKENSLYNPDNERYTNRRLNSLKTYRFVNIRYTEDSVLTDGKGQLDAAIYLSPLAKRAFRTELEAVTKSNNFAGPSFNLEYLNRNLFKGGEALSISGKVGYETQISSKELAGLNSFETGLKTELIVPRMISIIPLQEKFRYTIPITKFRLSYDLLRRSQWFSLNSFLAVYGFEWNPNPFVTHSLNPISINYIRISNQTDAFITLLEDNRFLERSFEQQFIPGLSYSFQFNQLVRNIKRNRFYFMFNADFSGNALALAQNIGGIRGDDKSFWGQEYAQFSRFDVDIRNYQEVGKESRFVSRIFAGFGLPYGNSVSLPYSKQYFSGGPNSVRAFPIRSIGPGIYVPEGGRSSSSFFDQAGDIKIEANIEYRFPLISFLKGAVFTDAGNIWLKNDDGRGGKFTSNWINELAIGSGFGIRLDIEFFVIRLDVATPLRKPGPNGFIWQDSFRMGDKSWRQDNITWNFGIGYPF